ncbi:hypothetical protein SSX86_031474, partial [Deinandra increscens subsp. villosa]
MGGRPEIHNQYARLIISDLLHTVISSTVANQPPISSTVANQPPPSLTSAVLTTIAADLAPSLQCPSSSDQSTTDHHRGTPSVRHSQKMEASCSESLSGSKKDAPVIDVDEENLKEPVDSVDDQAVEQDKKDGARQRSYVWKHFKRDEKVGKATCEFCKKAVAADSKVNG